MGVASAHEFGEIDKKCHNLVKLPILEKAGIIWVTLDPKSNLDILNFLSGYDGMLDLFGLENWHIFDTRVLKGPNWKVAYDGYLDLYHLPVLHKDTFGPNMSNQANYFEWGPHQRVISPYRPQDHNDLSENGKSFMDLPVEKWPMDMLMAGVWTIFPHISIASFNGGGRSIMLSQLLPGENVEESYTQQYYLMEKEPNKQQSKEAKQQFDFLEFVVDKEDYDAGLRLQKGLKTGLIENVMFGKNEGGGQKFHEWVDKIINTNDNELPSLFI